MDQNIVNLLRKGDKRTIRNVDEVIELSKTHKAVIGTLVGCMSDADEGLAMRASDALEKISAKQHEILKPYKSRLLNILRSTNQKEVLWHLAQIIPRLPLSQHELQEAATVWSKDFYNSNSSILRTFSLQAMHDVSNRDPRLYNLYSEMVQYALIHGSIAMQSRAKKLLKG